METNPGIEEKINFLKNNLFDQLNKLQAQEKGSWGVMNAQQMTEHLSDSFRVSNGRDNKKLTLPAEQAEKVRAFFLSDKLFRENTKNALLPEIPPQVRNESMQQALSELKEEFEEFINYFKNNPDTKTTNPLAGDLTFEEWLHLHYKHSIHHLKQFEKI